MKKVLIFLFLIPLFSFADSGFITFGGYGSFLKRTDSGFFSPSYFFIDGYADISLTDDLNFTAELQSLAGLPADQTRFLYNSYMFFSPRLQIAYSFKKVKIGLISTFNVYNPSENNSVPIYQNGMTAGGTRKFFTQHEFFLRAEPVKDLKISADLAYNIQMFHPDQEIIKNDFRDSNIRAAGSISYSVFSLLSPFISVEHFNDLNKDNRFDLTGIKAGLRGEKVFTGSGRFYYDLHYKRFESTSINDKNRMTLDLGYRWSNNASFDIFSGFYQEYSLSENNDLHYVTRQLYAMFRYWPVKNRFALWTGAFVRFEELKKDFWMPVAPFAGVLCRVKSFDAQARYIVRLDRDLQKKYSDINHRLDLSLIYTYRWFSPGISFLYNYRDEFSINSMGMNIYLSAVM